MPSRYENKRAFITGATGFIGGRLSEVLALECKAHVKVLVRDFSTAVRIGRLPVAICKGDVTEIDEVREAMNGADFVFHCAYGNKGDDKERAKATILGTENILKAAVEEKVKCVVFLSTQSVYGHPDAEWIDEKTLKNPKGDSYGRSKLQAERIVQKYYEAGLNTVIIQPTAVYGPWARSYGTRIFDLMHKNWMPLIDNGQGVCNAVYIDDLIQALLLAAISEKSYGQSFLISGAEYCTWKDFWGFYENIIGKKRAQSVTKKALLRLYKKSKRRPSLLGLVKIDTDVLYEILRIRWISWLYLLGRNIVPKRLISRMKNAMVISSEDYQRGELKRTDTTGIVFDPSSIDLFASKTKIRIKKAMEILKYCPRFSLRAGFEETKQWYRWFYSNS